MIQNFIMTWVLSSLISMILLFIGIARYANKFGWHTCLSNEDLATIEKLHISAFIIGYNMLKTGQFALRPFDYIKG